MGDRKDKDPEKDADAGVTILAGGGGGLQRSRRGRELAPLPTSSPSEGGGGSSAGELKWKREEGGEEAGEEDEVTHDGDDVKVMKSVKVSSIAEAGVDRGEEETGKMSLCQQQPLRGEMGRARQLELEEVEGTLFKLGDASSSLVSMSSAAGGSEDGSSELSVGEEEPHPCLFIENILEVIFKHVVSGPGSGKEVQSIRLVCRTWTDPATRVYRRNGPTIVFNNYDQECLSRRRNLAGFMDTMKSSQMIPVQKFHFYGGALGQEDPKLFRDFLLICGPEVVSLDLLIKSGEAKRIMSNLKNLPELNMPKLRALKIRTNESFQSEVQIEANRAHEIVSLVQLLLTAELTELDLSCSPPCGTAYLSGQVSIMEQLGPIIATGIPRTVKQLKLSLEINESTFNKLAEVGLKLERFEFWVPDRSVFGRRIIYEFLKSQASTLKHFRLWDWSSQSSGIFIDFPRLNELVNFLLDNAIISIPPALDFAKAFPVLHRLDMGGMDTEDAFRALLSSTKAPSPFLKVLHLPSWRHTSLAPLIRDVARSFPCVVDLHISLFHSSRETLLEIFKYFDNLESLDISFLEVGLIQTIESSHWSDSLFSGISEHDCSIITDLDDFENVNLNDFQRQPSILNLTKLRKLSVDNDCESDVISFTDFSAHFVFLEMGNLREICFIGDSTHPTLFTPRYADLLRERLHARGGVFNIWA